MLFLGAINHKIGEIFMNIKKSIVALGLCVTVALQAHYGKENNDNSARNGDAENPVILVAADDFDLNLSSPSPETKRRRDARSKRTRVMQVSLQSVGGRVYNGRNAAKHRTPHRAQRPHRGPAPLDVENGGNDYDDIEVNSRHSEEEAGGDNPRVFFPGNFDPQQFQQRRQSTAFSETSSLNSERLLKVHVPHAVVQGALNGVVSAVSTAVYEIAKNTANMVYESAFKTNKQIRQERQMELQRKDIMRGKRLFGEYEKIEDEFAVRDAMMARAENEQYKSEKRTQQIDGITQELNKELDVQITAFYEYVKERNKRKNQPEQNASTKV